MYCRRYFVFVKLTQWHLLPTLWIQQTSFSISTPFVLSKLARLLYVSSQHVGVKKGSSTTHSIHMHPRFFCCNEWWLCHLASMEQQKPTAKCLETCLRIKFAASTEPLFSFHHERDFFLTFLFLLLSLSYTAASKHKKKFC